MRKVKLLPGMLEDTHFISRDVGEQRGKAWKGYCPLKTAAGSYWNNEGQYLGKVILGGDLMIEEGEVVMVTDL